jgi:hypothetical protein
MLFRYQRLGGLCPGAFLKKWGDPANNYTSYKYPPDSGFQLSTSRMPIMGNETLLPGMVLDRFGSEYGTFLAPVNTPFSQRALPPASLNAPPSAASNYHVYEVMKSFTADTGTIAAWFGQPGQGTQYFAPSSIATLIANGFLKRLSENGGLAELKN